jgi:hypothetical protein
MHTLILLWNMFLVKIVTLNKTSFQSSTFVESAAGATSGLAVDGDTNAVYRDGSCTHTSTSTNPWWTVDLCGIYDVSKVVIYNRGDCCGMCMCVCVCVCVCLFIYISI